MEIARNTTAVFWKGKDSAVQFHADMPRQSPDKAARAFSALFPADVVCSVRDPSGRFAAFKRPAQYRPSKREAAAMAAEYCRYRYND